MTAQAAKNANLDAVALARAYHHNHNHTATEIVARMTYEELVRTLIASANLIGVALNTLAKQTGGGTTADTYYNLIVRCVETTNLT